MRRRLGCGGVRLVDLGERSGAVPGGGARAGGRRRRGDAGAERAARLVPRQRGLALFLDLPQRQAA